jgi:hypothetical protein
MTKEKDTFLLAADANNKVMILHSPKNLDGTRSRPDNKFICMLGLSARTTYFLFDLKTALADSHLMVPTVAELSDCKTAKDVTNIAAPNKNGLIGFEGSSIFIPAPVIHNAILTSGPNEIFKLVPIVNKTVHFIS